MNLRFDPINLRVQLALNINSNLHLLEKKLSDLPTVFLAKAFNCANFATENLPRDFSVVPYKTWRSYWRSFLKFGIGRFYYTWENEKTYDKYRK